MNDDRPIGHPIDREAAKDRWLLETIALLVIAGVVGVATVGVMNWFLP